MHIWELKKEKKNETNLALYLDFIEKEYKIDCDKNFIKIVDKGAENYRNHLKSIIKTFFSTFSS